MQVDLSKPTEKQHRIFAELANAVEEDSPEEQAAKANAKRCRGKDNEVTSLHSCIVCIC